MRFALAIIFLINITYANTYDLVQMYRKNGIEEVEKQIKSYLLDKDYWNYYLKNIDVSNGYYESIQYVMICQKDKKDIVLYDKKANEKIFYSSVFTGKEDGDKQKEGDLKTPVGAYSITNRLTKIDPFYGPLALTTDYPNDFDKVRGKTGHGIWIHGVPENDQRDEYTKGCIALDNNKITKLDNSINIDNSVLIISEKKFKNITTNDIAIILSSVFKWKKSWEESDIQSYLDFYDEEFMRTNGQDKEAFTRYKTRVFNKDEKKSIEFYNINVIPYPTEDVQMMFKIYMDERYISDTYRFEGKKELYVELKNNKFSILTEN